MERKISLHTLAVKDVPREGHERTVVIRLHYPTMTSDSLLLTPTEEALLLEMLLERRDEGEIGENTTT